MNAGAPRLPGRHIDETKAERIRKARRDNPELTIRQLQERFKVGPLTITRALKSESITPKSTAAKSRAVSPETIAEVMRRFAAGETAEWIGRSLGLQPIRVQKVKERELLRQRDARGAA